jgi:hypothetical protein
LNNIAQPKVGRQSSIANALSEIGIPEWVVQLRQNAVHREMPSLLEFRRAIEFCREWVQKRYWEYVVSVALLDGTGAEETDEQTVCVDESEDQEEIVDENGDGGKQADAPQIFTLAMLKEQLKKRRSAITDENAHSSNGNWCLTSLKTPLGLANDQSTETLDLQIK